MSPNAESKSRLRGLRVARGWSQADLAATAGISRAAVSAIEGDRLVPSVRAALALAAALDCTVEDLFGTSGKRAADLRWAWPPRSESCRYWESEVRGHTLRYPTEFGPTGIVPHDGVFDGTSAIRSSRAHPSETLVLACCDPAAGLLATEYARATGFRMVVLSRAGGEALTLLRAGLVHAAGIHFGTSSEPTANRDSVRNAVGADCKLVHVAHWEAGLALAPEVSTKSIAGVLRADLHWVGREPGSAARRCLDELRSGRPAPRRLARDHHGVAEAVRAGWADVGVCHRLPCEEAGLRFLPVRVESYDLCFSTDAERDPRITGLVRTVRSAAYRRLVADLPGINPSDAGELETVGAN
jgi:molybdate-binding protein/DNA-binding XRE family transcriptional regulator